MAIVEHECAQILKHHSGSVLNVKFTDNGQYCISTSQDKTLVLWNPLKGLAIKEYRKPHNHEINDVAIFNDNSCFISCGGDKFAFLWDVTTGDVLRKFGGHNGKLNCCQLAGDNNSLLLTGCYDKTVRIFDLRAHHQGRPFQIIEDAKDAISSILITSDKRILTGSVDGCVRCYDIRFGRVHTDTFPAPVVVGALSRDNRCYVASCLNNTIELVELDSGQHLNIYQGHKNVNYALNCQISPDDAYVISGSEDGRLCIWDIGTSASENYNGPLQELAFSNTTISKDALSFQENVRHSQGMITQNDWGCVFAVRFHPQKWYFLSCHNDRTLRVWKKRGSLIGV